MTTSRFARRIVGTSLRSAGTIAAPLILSVLVGLGLFLPCNPDPGVGTPLSKKSYESNLESFQGLLDSDFARVAPSEDIDLTKREVAALERAVAASSTSEFINAATEFFDLEIESAKHGYLITDVRALSAQRDYLLLFAELEHPTLGYASTLEAPALYYASSMIWTIPYLAFYLPCSQPSLRPRSTGARAGCSPARPSALPAGSWFRQRPARRPQSRLSS